MLKSVQYFAYSLFYAWAIHLWNKKDMSPAYFFTISYRSFQHLSNFLKIWKNNTSPKYQAKTNVIFSQLLSFNLNYCPWHQTFKKMCMLNFYLMLWLDIAWYILAIDSFHIVSAHAPNSLVRRYLREITREGATFIRLPYIKQWNMEND